MPKPATCALAYPGRDGFIFRPGVNPRGLGVRLRGGGVGRPDASYAVEADGPARGWIDLGDLEQPRVASWDVVQRAVATWQMRMDIYKARNRPQLARETQRAIVQLDRVDADLSAVGAIYD